MSYLLLAEHKYQVNDLVNRELASQAKWIALGPSAMSALEELGIPYQIPEDFYESHELEKVCQQSHKDTKKLCSLLDHIFQKKNPDFKKWKITPFLFHYPPLSMRIDVLRSRIFQLYHIFASYPGYQIYMHNQSGNFQNTVNQPYSNLETIWGHIGSLKGWPFSIIIIKNPKIHINSKKRGNFILSLLRRIINRSIFLYSAAHNILNKDYYPLKKILSFKKNKSLLMMAPPYDWKHALPLLRKKGWQILFSSNDMMSPHQTNVIHQSNHFGFDSASIERVKPYLKQNGVSFYTLIESCLAWIFNNYPPHIRNLKRNFDHFSKIYKIHALIRSASTSGIAHATNQFARLLGIPVFTWQHGHIGYDKTISQFNNYYNSLTSDYTFVYGEGSKRAHTVYSEQFNSCVVSTGSAHLDAVKSSIAIDRDVLTRPINRVLYVTTNYYQNRWYYGMSPGLSDCHLYLDQKKIIQDLLRFKKDLNFQLTIKLHPSLDFMDPPWIDGIRTNGDVKIIKKVKNFSKLLGQNDLIILDYPSTTLLQSIATKLPVFALMRHWEYHQSMLEPLRLRVVCKDNVEALMESIQRFLKYKEYPSSFTHTTFLKEFGTYTNDGNSAQRVSDFVNSTLSNAVYSPNL